MLSQPQQVLDGQISRGGSSPAQSVGTSPSAGRSNSPQYIMDPSFDELMDMSESELSRLQGFSISMPGIGKVKFLEPVNLLQASPTGTKEGIREIPGTIVVLRHKMIEVYPGETDKDPVGMGVNVPAEVQLERCWAIDKATGKVIEDESDPRFDRHFRKLQSVEGTKMLGFLPKTGSWKFRVEHFSRYGLDDDDDDAYDGQDVQSVPIAGEDSDGMVFAEEDEVELDDEDDESFSLREDSFANILARGGGVKGGVGRVKDLRAVVFGKSTSVSEKGAKWVTPRQKRHTSSDILPEADAEFSFGEELQTHQTSMADATGRDLMNTDFLASVEDERVEEEEKVDMAAVVDDEEEEVPLRRSITVAPSPYTSAAASLIIGARRRPILFGTQSSLTSFSRQETRIRTVPISRLVPTSGISPVKRGRSDELDFSQSPADLTVDDEDVRSRRRLEFQVSEISPMVSTAVKMDADRKELQQSPVREKPHFIAPLVPSISPGRSGPPISASVDVNAEGFVKESTNIIPAPPAFGQSLLNHHQRLCVDAGLVIGRSCRVGWGPSGSFVVAGRFAGSESLSVVKIEQVKVFASQRETDPVLREALIAAEKNRHILTFDRFLRSCNIFNTKTSHSNSGAEIEEAVVPNILSSTASGKQKASVFDGIFEKKRASLPLCPIAVLESTLKFSDLADVSTAESCSSSVVPSLWVPSPASSHDDPRRTFTKTEMLIWMLASAVWDEVQLPAHDKRTSQAVSGLRAITVIEALRKDQIGGWLKAAVEEDIGHETSKKLNTNAAERTFFLLAGRQLGKAVREAIASKDFRLASIIAQCGGANSSVILSRNGFGSSETTSLRTTRIPFNQSGGPSSSVLLPSASGHSVPGRGAMYEAAREDLIHQVSIWTKMIDNANVPSRYLKIWKLLSGEVRLWDHEVISTPMDWKQTFGLYLWYANGGGLSLPEAVAEYERAWQDERTGAKPPLPSYLEGKDHDSGTKWSADICYEILKLATDGTYLLEKALVPTSVRPDLLDCRVTWALWAVLSRAKKSREFADHKGTVTVKLPEAYLDSAETDDPMGGGSIILNGSSGGGGSSSCGDSFQSWVSSSTADSCTVSICESLQSLGLWKWACFSALFLSNKGGRESLLKRLLSQWYPMSDDSGSCGRVVRSAYSASPGLFSEQQVSHQNEISEDWAFIVDRLKVPEVWVHEAKALRARYSGNDLQEAISLIDAQKYDVAHRIVVQTLSPDLIINGNYAGLRILLGQFPGTIVDSWSSGGGIILEFIKCVEGATEEVGGAASKTLSAEWMSRLRSVLVSLQVASKAGGFLNVGVSATVTDKVTRRLLQRREVMMRASVAAMNQRISSFLNENGLF